MRIRMALATAAALVAAPAALIAQDGVRVKGGLSYGNVSNRGLLPGNLEERTGFAIGLSVASTGGLLGYGAEALYAQRGVTSPNDSSARKLDYVDVPVYLRAMVPTPGIAPYAYAGPQFSFELRCRTGAGACPASDRPKTTFSAVLGGGVRFGAADHSITLEGRYVYGLTDLKLSTVTSSDSYKTRSFMLLAGISF